VARYDVESLLQEIADRVKTYFNTKVAEINAEKGDFTLANLDTTNAIFFFNENNKDSNYDPYMVISIDRWDTSELGESRLDINVEVCVGDPIDGTIDKRVLRYIRILRELFKAGENVGPVSIPKVGQLEFIGFADETNKEFRAGGITLNAVYA